MGTKVAFKYSTAMLEIMLARSMVKMNDQTLIWEIRYKILVVRPIKKIFLF